VALTDWLSFTVLTSPSLSARQLVSAPHLLASFRCSDESLSLRSTGSKSPSLAGFFRYPDESLSLRSAESECPPLAGFTSLS
jgi:hypothetical protein